MFNMNPKLFDIHAPKTMQPYRRGFRDGKNFKTQNLVTRFRYYKQGSWEFVTFNAYRQGFIAGMRWTWLTDELGDVPPTG